jgi:hypothetical protein
MMLIKEEDTKPATKQLPEQLRRQYKELKRKVMPLEPGKLPRLRQEIETCEE